MAFATGMPAHNHYSLIKKTFFMKHSFIALSILAAAFTVTLVACSKKEWLPTDETTIAPEFTIPAASNDTPYGKSNTAILVTELVKQEPVELVFIPMAKEDTPYGKNNPALLPPVKPEGAEIKIILAAMSDTPYGK
jgi:hypothetical protein